MLAECNGWSHHLLPGVKNATNDNICCCSVTWWVWKYKHETRVVQWWTNIYIYIYIYIYMFIHIISLSLSIYIYIYTLTEYTLQRQFGGLPPPGRTRSLWEACSEEGLFAARIVGTGSIQKRWLFNFMFNAINVVIGICIAGQKLEVPWGDYKSVGGCCWLRYRCLESHGLPRIARPGAVCRISTRGSARKARIEKSRLSPMETHRTFAWFHSHRTLRTSPEAGNRNLGFLYSSSLLPSKELVKQSSLYLCASVPTACQNPSIRACLRDPHVVCIHRDSTIHTQDWPGG